MVNSCCVATCRFKYSHGSTRSFHKFPLKNPKLLAKWISIMGRTSWTPNKYSYICSAHFTDDCFRGKSKFGANVRLNPDAVPTIVTPCQERQEQGSEDAVVSETNAKEELPVPCAESASNEILYDETGPSKRPRLNLTEEAADIITNKNKYVIKFVPQVVNGETKNVPILVQETEPEVTQDVRPAIAIPGPSSVNLHANVTEKAVEEEIKLHDTESDSCMEVHVVMAEGEDGLVPVECMNIKVVEQNNEEDVVISDSDEQADGIDLLPIFDDDEEVVEVFNEEQIKVAAAAMQKKCRICSYICEDMTDIFSQEGEKKKLLQKIKRCLPIKAPQQSGTLPNRVCYSCEQKLEYCDEFAQLALNSDKAFRMEDIKINLPVAPSDVEYVSEEDDSGSSVASFVDRMDQDFQPEFIESEMESDISEIEEVEQIKRKKQRKPKSKKSSSKSKNEELVSNKIESCNICDASFRSKYLLNMHKQNIHDKETCELCNADFMSKKELENHHETSHCHCCKMCCEVFTDTNDLETHLKTVHPDSLPKFISGKYTITENVQCSLCTAVSKDNRYAKRHYFLHHQKYACEICFELFPNSEVQTEHTRQIHGITCRFCTIVFYCNNNLKIHVNNAHEGARYPLKVKKSPSQLYECKICNKGLLSKTNVKRHNYWCHKIFTCDFCLHECKSFKELDKHFIDEHGKKCYYCNKVFDNIDTLNLHIDYVHADYNPYCCENCGVFFKNRNLLKSHRITHIEDVEILHCNDCGQGFSTEKLLAFHRKYRHSERKQICGICNKKFLTGYDLRKHIKTHERKEMNIKQFPCTLCDKSLSAVRSLQHHMRVQHNKMAFVKRHLCEICQENFTTKTNLKKHIKSIHNSLTYYKCLVCKQDYSSEENVISHLSFHKPIEIQRLKTPYIKFEAMNCEFCKHYFSCKMTLTKHIVNRHLLTKFKLKKPPKVAKLQQIFQLCKMKQFIKHPMLPKQTLYSESKPVL